MRKFTYNMTAGIKYAFPSCKTFVFLRANYNVSFKFISMWKKVDKEIDAFKDSFSITAKDYFLQIEVISSVDQEVSAILIDDEKVHYQPIMGEVTVANTPLPITGSGTPLPVSVSNSQLNVLIQNSTPIATTGTISNTISAQITNTPNMKVTNSGISINDTIPVLQPSGQVLHVSKACDFDKYPNDYTDYTVEHFFSFYSTPSAHATNVHCCSPASISGTSQATKYHFLTEIKITPDRDCNFVIYLTPATGAGTHSYVVSTYQKFYKNIVGMSGETTYQRLLTETTALSNFSSNDILYEKIPLKANIQAEIELTIPIKLNTRSSWGFVPTGFCTLCTDIPAQYDISLKTKYYKSDYFIPKTFV